MFVATVIGVTITGLAFCAVFFVFNPFQWAICNFYYPKHGIGFLFFSSILVLALIARLLVARKDRKTGADQNNRITHWFDVSLFTLPVLLLFLWLGLSWGSSQPLPSWTSEGPASAPVAGRLPFSDASGWYLVAKAILGGTNLDWGARRPLHAFLKAGQLAATGGYQASLLLQTLIVGASVGALVFTFSRITHFPAALVVMVSLVKFSGEFVGSYLSEAHGLAIACIGTGLAIWGWDQQKFWIRFLGYLFFALAWTIRPGPLFILAWLPMAEVFLCPKIKIRHGVVTIVGILMVLAISRLAFSLVSNPGATPNANAANTVLGLAMGKDWSQATEEFFSEDRSRHSLATKDQTRLMYRRAWEKIRDNPWPFINQTVANLQSGFTALSFGVPRETAGLNKLFAVFWWVVMVVSLYFLLQNRSRWALFLLGMGMSLVLSIPLIWGDGGWRGITLGLPAWICLLSLAFASRANNSPPNPMPCLILLLPGLAIVALILLGLGCFLYAKNETSSDSRIKISMASPLVNVSTNLTQAKAFGILTVSPESLSTSLEKTGLTVYGIDKTLTGIRPPYAIAVVGHARAPEQTIWMVLPGLTMRPATLVWVSEFVMEPDGYVGKATKWVSEEP